MLLYNMALAHVLSSSDDEDFANIVNRRPKNVRRRPAHFYEFDDIDFHARFRLSKECITEVLEAIEPEISHPTERLVYAALRTKQNCNCEYLLLTKLSFNSNY